MAGSHNDIVVAEDYPTLNMAEMLKEWELQIQLQEDNKVHHIRGLAGDIPVGIHMKQAAEFVVEVGHRPEYK